MRKLVALAVVLFVVIANLVGASPVSADHCDDDRAALIGGEAVVQAEDCTHTNPDSDPGPGGGDPARDLWNARCSAYGAYVAGETEASVTRGQAVSDGDTAFDYTLGFGGYAATPQADRVTVPVGETWYNWSIACRTPAGVVVTNEIGPAAGPAPVNPLDLRDRALARIRIDDPTMAANPPLDDPDRFSVVQISTWFWLEDPWGEITEDEAEGGVAVTVTATPLRVEWDTGDGELVTCDDAGVAWASGMADDQTDCRHTYTEPSAGVGAGDAYEVTATVFWEFSWTLNGTDQGVFATYEPETTVSHQVGEIQAVGKATP